MSINIRSIALWVLSVKGRRTDHAAKRYGLPLNELQAEVDRLRRLDRLERARKAARNRPKRPPSLTVQAADWVYSAPCGNVRGAIEQFGISRQTIEREMQRRARLAVAWLSREASRTIEAAATQFKVPELWVTRAWRRR